MMHFKAADLLLFCCHRDPKKTFQLTNDQKTSSKQQPLRAAGLQSPNDGPQNLLLFCHQTTFWDP